MTRKIKKGTRKVPKTAFKKGDKRLLGNKFRKGKPAWNKGKRGWTNSGSFQKEKEHWNWKGGKTKLVQAIKNSFQYKEWRHKVFVRDGFCCVECHKIGGKLNAHHIIPLSVLLEKNKIRTLKQALNCKELFDVNNGITLSLDCHLATKNYGGKNKK